MPDNVIPPEPLKEPPFIQEAEIVPTPPVQEPQPEVKAEAKAEEKPKVVHKYRVVRAEGDPIFLIDNDKKRHWILNSKTYKALGYNFGEEQKIPQAELATYMPGEALTMDNYTKYV
jgi:hypothetical protein